eukprot:TRINITY_DN15006_c0_g1_i1.p1 TRINITY_DN15006_c0_g1~~TRINITY_DN15006_c0_g1_i1.p1  ORF type:complete len:359 (+),score=42.26 TRINITY_DN15006_c0_g1_i1:16-1092(+)
MVLKFRGSAYFRQRIICATLSGKSIAIREIRAGDEKPGLREYEASLLRLMDKISNGCKIEIDYTGTTVYYKPGVLTGGKVEHDCGLERGIGYFLEVILCLAPFCKKPVKATFMGITNHSDNLDASADLFRTVFLPNMRHFGITEGLNLKIVRRGMPPQGGGVVTFECPIIKTLSPVQILDDGEVKRIRGIAYTARLSPEIGNRMIETAKAALTKYTGDVYVYGDHYKGKESGNSSGFGLTIVAETTSGALLSSELVAKPQQLPEDLAKECSHHLLMEILRRGVVDSVSQSVAILFMALGPEDVSKIRVGKLTEYTMEFLRNIREFFGVTFKIEPDPETKTVILTCVGCSFLNLARRVQ